ncbi:hypothetical protein [Acidovorax delafieldii]|uniref:hypothetical protein n=1 Tax=Acidovorax delafieldii TaxID=47920 RepID=UPI00375817E5
MRRSTPTGDVAADLVVEILQHLVHSTGSAPRLSTIEACVLLDTASEDVGETYLPNKDKQQTMRELASAIRQRMLATDKPQ